MPNQRFHGYAKLIASVAAGALLIGGACTGRYIVTVDEDVDASTLDEVLWAVTTRCGTEIAIDIVLGFLTSPLEQCSGPERGKGAISQLIGFSWMPANPITGLISSRGPTGLRLKLGKGS